MARRTFLPIFGRTRAQGVLVLLALWLVASALRAQTFDATHLHQLRDLGVTWLVHAGDDPAYAQSDFNDSGWTRIDPNTSLRMAFPGHPPVIWYRLHVKVEPDQTGLALAEWNLSSAFDIYVNGHLLIRNGQVAPYHPYTFDARLIRAIPDQEVATGNLVLALRLHISRYEWDNAYPGLYPYNLTLGQQTALRDHIWLAILGQHALSWVNLLGGLGLGIVALAMFLSERRHWEYFWIFLQFFAGALILPFILYRLFHNMPPTWAIARVPLALTAFVAQVLMYFAFLRVPMGRWFGWLLVAATLGGAVAQVGMEMGNIPVLMAVLAQTPMLALLAGIVLVMLLVHYRRGNREAGILLIPVVLFSLNIYTELVLFILQHIPAFFVPATRINMEMNNLQAGPFAIQIGDVSNAFYILSLAVIIVLRSTRISRQQALLEGELAAAREVQQILLPEQIESVPGFSIESVYQPAQQVGGDFFQILPAGDGGLLVVVGDVAGKGLPAAMLVSVIVGAIRAVSQYTSDPAQLLANLNERLVGRSGGSFSTALAAYIGSDGQVVLANAGHLSPYLDGREIDLPGALPLGIQAGLHYEASRIFLPPGSRLTFYSDGVVEAQNPQGELFGFERSRAFSTQSAAAIVQAAQRFGQQDDMTVIAVARQAVPA